TWSSAPRTSRTRKSKRPWRKSSRCFRPSGTHSRSSSPGFCRTTPWTSTPNWRPSSRPSRWKAWGRNSLRIRARLGKELNVGDTAETKAAAVVDVTALVPADLAKAREMAKGISVEDSQSIVQYGISAQIKISGFADTMLDQIRTKDAGEVGAALSDLVFKIKEVDVGSLASEHKGLFANLVNAAERFMARYSKLETQIEKIVDDLNELDLFLAAGQIKLDELRSSALPELQAKAKSSGDPMDAQKLND